MRQVTLLGRAGSDGELKYTANGTAVFNVSVCVSEKRNEVTESHWFDVVVWSRSAEIAKEQIRKGAEIVVLGKLAQRSWTKEGQKHSKTEIIAERIRVTAYKKEDSQALSSATEVPHWTPPAEDFGDMPF